jgi:uncharacterized protein YndB with AHSA1/START domain
VAAHHDTNQIRLTRVYDAPLRAVWDAWSVPEQVEKWWGPRGFTLTTHSKDFRPGGTWRYTMHGPDGVDYPNLATYHVVEPLKTLVYDHGATDDSPPLFHVTATFADMQGRTTLDLVFRFATPQIRMQMEQHIKQAGGNATWDRLAEHLEEGTNGRRCFVINRTLAAPITRVFQMWTDPAQLAQWLPPAGMQMRFLRANIAVGQSSFFVIEGEHGKMHVRTDYMVLESPRRIVYRQQFVDAHEQLAPAPGSPVWPPTLLMTVLLSEEAPDRTRITVTCEPHGDTTVQEIAAFEHERAGMTMGWTGSFDALEAVLS